MTALLGPLVYGGMAYVAGCLVDQDAMTAKAAVIGLALMGCTFLLIPARQALPLALPLHPMFETSFAFYDLFVWITLGMAALQFRRSPHEVYGTGLAMNGLAVMMGLGLQIQVPDVISETALYTMALMAGVVLFVGVIPVFSLSRIISITKGTSIPKPLAEYVTEEVDRLIQSDKCLVETLTPREKEILYLLLTGKSNAEIGEEENISKNTLKTHIRNIYGKMGVKNRTELLMKCRQGIAEVETEF